MASSLHSSFVVMVRVACMSLWPIKVCQRELLGTAKLGWSVVEARLIQIKSEVSLTETLTAEVWGIGLHCTLTDHNAMHQQPLNEPKEELMASYDYTRSDRNM